MSDKDGKRRDDESSGLGDDRDSEQPKKDKDGKRRKLKFGKRFRSSFAWAACVSGNKSPDEEVIEEGQDLAAGGNSGKPSPMFKERHPLVERSSGPGWHYGTLDDEDKMLDEILGKAEDAVALDMFNDEYSFPDEKIKTFVALSGLVFAFVLNTVSLVMTHERRQEGREPLPDIFLDTVPTVDDALYVGEVFIMLSTFATVILMTLHRYRWIVFRRCFTIMSLLYLLRAVTMYVTVLPVASYTYHCDPKMNSSSVVLEGTLRVLKLVSGFGLSINGQHTFCGDYIFSGHTVVLVLAFLLIQEYSPNNTWQWQCIHWSSWLVSLTGVILVMVARGHYTIDVIIAYYITTRTFWIYHTIANTAELKIYTENNFLTRVWWFRYFLWLEGNIKGSVPRQYSLPFSSDPNDSELEE